MGHGLKDGPKVGLGSNQLDRGADVFGKFGSIPKNGPHGLLSCGSQNNPKQTQQKKDPNVIIVIKLAIQKICVETCMENR